MSRKYNTRHPERNKSKYPARLAKRGLNRSPEMESLKVLRERQDKRKEQTGVPWYDEGSSENQAA